MWHDSLMERTSLKIPMYDIEGKQRSLLVYKSFLEKWDSLSCKKKYVIQSINQISLLLFFFFLNGFKFQYSYSFKLIDYTRSLQITSKYVYHNINKNILLRAKFGKSILSIVF